MEPNWTQIIFQGAVILIVLCVIGSYLGHLLEERRDKNDTP